MKERIKIDVVVILIEINGVRHVYGVPRSFVGERAPEELTIGEISRFPELSGLALFADFLNRRGDGKAVAA